jgi:hypothetical protein
MSPAARQHASPPPGDADAPLAELEELLRRQLSLARRGRLDEVEALNGEVGRLLGRAERLPPARRAAEALRRIASLRERLVLTLAQRRHDAAGEIDRLRKGRRTLRAYGGRLT